jgi:ABC-2 type transport system ATP-binding protein
MTDNIITLKNLSKKYNNFTAVNHLNLDIRKGEIFGLLGSNGAGKSTTILMMLGMTEPTEGTAKVCGLDPTRQPVEVKQQTGYLPEDVGFYDNRTGLENLMYTARLNSLSDCVAKKRALELLNRVGLSKAIDQKAGTYSRGMRQRLGLADVLIKTPKVIVLDEPTSGIDPQGVKTFLELIVRLRDEEGLTVLFSSHNLNQVEQVCDRVGIFVKGRLMATGDIKSLSQQIFDNDSQSLDAIYNHFFEGEFDHE